MLRRWLHNRPVALQVALPQILVALFLGLVVIDTATSLLSLRSQFKDLEARSFNLLSENAATIQRVQSFQIDVFQLVLTATNELDPDKLTRLTGAVKSDLPLVETRLQAQADLLAALPEGRDEALALRASIAEYREQIGNLSILIAATPVAAVVGLVGAEQVSRAILDSLDHIRALAHRNWDHDAAYLENHIQASLTRFIVVSLAAVAGGFLVSLLISGNLILAVRSLTGAMGRLAKGDTRLDIPGISQKDEIGGMARAVSVFKENLIRIASMREDEARSATALRQERDRAEQALEKFRLAQEQLIASEKLASLGSLVAGMAHEVNTPIGVGVTIASTLVEKTRAFRQSIETGQIRKSVLDQYAASTDEGCGVLLRNLERAHELITGFQQLATDQTSSHRRAFKLDEVAESVRISMYPMMKHSSHRLETDIPASLPALDSYPGPLAQILTNLITNALAHAFENREGGTMRLTAQALGTGEDETIRILFSDDGLGMEDRIRRRVFEPFFTTKLGKGGSGLGLNITYNLVTGLLGGKIEVESEPKRGTVFRIELPVTAPDQAAVMPPASR